MTEDRSFELEIEVAATPEEIWQAIATGEGVSAWLQPTEIEEHVGGRFAFELGGQSQWNETGKVAAYDKPYRFSTTGVRWVGPGGTDDAVTLATQWIVEPHGGGSCVVRLIMSGFDTGADWDEEVGGVREGMTRALATLRDYLSARAPRADAGGAVGRAVAGALVPVSDLDRSITFYRDVLGFEGSPTPTGYRLRSASGSAIYLLPSTDYPGQATWPLVTFECEDVEAFVSDLQQRGVSPLRDVPFDLDDRGIHTSDGVSIAWFTDPDGQALTAFQVRS